MKDAFALEAYLVDLDAIRGRVELKLRLAAASLSELPMADKPSWLEPAIEELIHEVLQPLTLDEDSILLSLEQLIRGLSAKIQNLQEPTLTWRSSDTLEVSWSPRLIWLIQPSRIKWPGVNVRAYTQEGDGSSGNLHVDVFMLAHSAIEHAAKVLEEPKSISSRPL